MSHFGIAGTRSGRIVARTAVVVAVLVLSLLAQTGLAQTTPPLNFGNNFFVTGDYVVAGAYGMNLLRVNGYTTGIISVPDINPGITGAKSVPAGAQIVAALLYWETVEKTSVTPGHAGSGQVGFFRPIYKNGPQPYQITGTLLNGNNTVAFGSGGCSGTSTGKTLRAYRADVRAYIPQDANGNTIPNGQYEIRLPSVGESTPLTLGATLVIIYRILSPDIPLNAIVIYDGAYTPTGSSLTMSQTLQGFYQAAANPVSRLTHIVGSGQINKYQDVYLNSVQLPSLYGPLPPFPGYYDEWDNPTWTFNGAHGNPLAQNTPLPASATTMVVPHSRNAGCVSWGAVILSTTVQNSDGDGILDVWKHNPPNPPGYCDAAVNHGVCQAGNTLDPGWVPLPGAALGQKDVFVQLDFMCGGSNGSQCTGVGDSFDPRQPVDPFDGKSAVDKVVDAHANSHVQLHVIPTHAMVEQTCTDPAQGPLQCSYANQPGVVGWKGGLIVLKNQLINPTTGILCSPGDPACVPVFQHGKKDSYRYALFAHAVALPNWTLYTGGGLAGVKQTGTTVTFTTSSPHYLDGNAQNPIIPPNNLGDNLCPHDGRVSVNFAISNPKLNGIYCATVTGPTTFTITAPFSTSTTSYTTLTDPNLAVSAGQAGAVSGFSDVGGQDSLITLGNWGADGQTWQTKAGTFMHELGHTSTLTHSGFTFKNLTSKNNDYTATLEGNCKPNFQSVMNYLFQVDLLDTGNIRNGNPVLAVDYSGQVLPNLGEASPTALLPNSASYVSTGWFGLTSVVGGTPATAHCDGTPLLGTDKPMSRVSFPTYLWKSGSGNDVNFDGISGETFTGHNDWMSITDPTIGGKVRTPGINLLEVSAAGTLSAIGAGGVQPSGGGGGVQPGGGGGGIQSAGGGGGIQPTGGGGGVQPGGGGGGVQPGGGGGGIQPGGGGGGVPEISHAAANAYTRPPQNLTASEEVSPRYIDLKWNPPTFGTIDRYNIYRTPAFASGSPMTVSVGDLAYDPSTNRYTFTDKSANCLSAGYTYAVSALLAPSTNQESVKSNSVSTTSTGALLTGCYTNAAPATPPAQTTIVLNNLSSGPSPVVQGNLVNITWSLRDDDTGAVVSNLNANTLIAIGPNSTRTTLVSKGIPSTQNANTFGFNAGKFTFSWDTDPFPAGSYTFELDLDSVTQTEITTSALQLQIDVNDTDTPHIDTTSVPDGVVGLAYNDPLIEDGGVGTVTWSFTGSLPVGIGLNPGTGVLSGTTCFAGSSNFTVKATDSKSNSGTQGFTLRINKANTTTSVVSNANPSVYGQEVTFTVTVAPQYSCTPTGTVTLYDGGTSLGSMPLSGGVATFKTYALSVATHTITASYSGDLSFNSSDSTSTPLSQVVNKANTTTTVTSNANPSVFQQMVTFTVNVAPPYHFTPTGTVSLYDGGVAIPGASNVGLTNGVATFTTSALSVVSHSITATYGGDGNFNGSNSNSAPVAQTVTQASTAITLNSVSPSPVFVNQPVTVSYTFGVVAPGAGSPIPPSGNITVTASDGSGCVVSAAAATALGTGACVLSPAPAAAGNITFTITYPGDINFVTSGANGNYNVYQLVFTTQPSNTGVGLTMTPAVVVTAEDASNHTLQSFTGSITLAIGSNPGTGTLSGTATQTAGAGVATFNDLSINVMGSGYTLVASPTGGIGTVTSNPFNIDGLLFAATDENTLSGTALPDHLGRFTINGTTVTGSSVLPVDYNINGMAQAGNFLYAGDPLSNTLRRIDFNGNLLGSVPAGFPAGNADAGNYNEGMAFDAAGTVLWHAHYPNEIEKLDQAGNVVATYTQPNVVGMTFVGNTIWITNWNAQQVGTWDPATNTFTAKFSTTANASGLAYDPVNGTLWVGLTGGSVVPYDPVTHLTKGDGFAPFGAVADTIDGLVFISQVP